ncbi:hypothetical protein KAR91_50030 [Candidatus Pacearchaeota archaeon]|nr:hypothetical protein [Candidatus Pacearchaeota archaeon]
MSETKRSRGFTLEVGDQEVSLCFRRPNQDDLFEVDKTYRKIYSAAILDGIMTEIQARRVHAESGTWTELHDKEIREIAQNIAQLEVVLRASDPTDPEALQLASNLNTLRAQMMSRIGDKQELFANTAEGLATEQKMHTFIERCCVYKESGEKFFANLNIYKEFVAEDPDQMSLIHKEAYFYEYRLPEEIARDWAEIEFVDRLNDEVSKVKAAETAQRASSKKTRTIKKKATKKKTAKKKTTKKRTRKTTTK